MKIALPVNKIWKENNVYFFLLLVILIQLILCVSILMEREYLFTDEVFTYGLANSEKHSFIDPDNAPEIKNMWVESSFFKEYIMYDASQPFSFESVWENQKNDVHPPFYYCLVHAICYFFQEAIYSPIPGTIINLIILCLTDLLLFYIAAYFCKSKWLALAVTVLWGFSAACFSNAIFIRMYLLQTLEILFLIGLHVYYFETRKNINLFFCISIIISIAIGGLTHYYYYFFAATFGFVLCLYFFIKKEFKNLVLYVVSLWSGVVLALLIFPATIKHIFGYRGAYATNNLGGVSLDKFKIYFNEIDKAAFGNCIEIIMFIILLWILWKLIDVFFYKISLNIELKNQGTVLGFIIQKQEKNKFTFFFEITIKTILFIAVALGGIFFVYVAIQGSEIVSLRYVYPIFPLISLMTICILKKTAFSKLNQWKYILLLSGCILVCSLSVNCYGIDWSYKDYPKYSQYINEIKGKDCIILCKDDSWVNVLQGINIYIDMDETRCVYESEINNLNDILSERKTDSELCIAFYDDAGYSFGEMNNILDKVIDTTQYSSYELKYDYYTKVYLLR